MRNHLLLNLALATFVVAAHAQAPAKKARASSAPAPAVGGDVVATVNGEAVYARQFDRDWSVLLAADQKTMTPQQMTPQWVQSRKKLLLDQIIERRLIVQEAKRREIAVPQKEIDQAVAQAKARFGRDANGKPRSLQDTEAAYKQGLASMNLTEKEFRENLKNDARGTLLTQQTLKKAKAPTEEQVRRLFSDVKAAMAKPDLPADADMAALTQYFRQQSAERVSVQHILVAVLDAATTGQIEAASKRAADLKAQLNKGASFGELAEGSSDDKATAPDGGQVGYIWRGEVPDVDALLFSLPVGGISDPVRTKRGFQIFRIQEKRAATDIRYPAASRYLAEQLARKAERDELAGFIGALKKAAKIEIKADFAKPS